MQASPAEFRRRLVIDAGGQHCLLSDALDDWQRRDYEALDSAWAAVAGIRTTDGKPIKPRYNRAYLERSRGHAKTSDLAVQVTWVLFAARRPLSGVAAAVDQDQAGLLKEAVDRLIHLNPWLGDYLKTTREQVSCEQTKSTLKILSADAASAWGLNSDFIVVDELTAWKKEDLWNVLWTTVPKRSHCLMVVISNAGFSEGEGWQWQVREDARQEPDWYFHTLPGPQASWILAKHLEEQRRMLSPLVFKRVWLNEWTAGSEDALEPAWINQAIKSTMRPLTAPEQGWSYVMGVDIGVRHDWTGLVIVGQHVGYTEEVEREPKPCHPNARILEELGWLDDVGPNSSLDLESEDEPDWITVEGTGRMRLAHLAIWKPSRGQPVDLDAVETAVIDQCKQFNCAAVCVDPSQAEGIIQRGAKQGLPIFGVPFSGRDRMQGMANAVMEAFSQGQIDLFRDSPADDLLVDLRNLRVTEKSYGIRLESPRAAGAGHGDAATALALALFGLKRFGDMEPAMVEGPLVCWP